MRGPMTDTATIEARLMAAEAALHSLQMGQAVTQVRTSDGKQVSYSAADIGQLRAYVRSLKRQLGLIPRGSAIGVSFR